MTDSDYHLLVVDDNRINRLKMTRALGQDGYQITEASGGQDALEQLRANSFDMVLLDLLMPDVSGFQVLEEIQNDQRLAGIPVVMVSAVDEQAEVERCLQQGAIDYITKPFDADSLRDRVRANLEKTGG